ncbi:MAG: cobalamin-dependent protein [Thermoleophilia bacterium]|nr:cobalamin-dependent protein [Thermoleophilia bacterium]
MGFGDLSKAVEEGDATTAVELTRGLLGADTEPLEILEDALVPAMDAIGRRFSEGEIYVPEMLIAARAMKSCLGVLQPLLASGDSTARGKVVLGTVKGDIHDIGKNIVAIMMEGSGFEVHDLGTDVDADRFILAIEELEPDIIGMSALLTTTMSSMKTTIDALVDAGLRDRVVVMVGGAPLTQEYAESIGADAYAPDAAAATERAKALLGVA